MNQRVILLRHLGELDDELRHELGLGEILAHERLVGAENSDGQPGAGEGVALHELRRQTQLAAQLSNFVLVEVGQRLDDLAVGSEPAHQIRVVVMRLDDVGLLRGQTRRRLDKVRSQGPLAEHHRARVQIKFADDLVGDLDEGVADDLPLLLRLDYEGEHLRFAVRRHAVGLFDFDEGRAVEKLQFRSFDEDVEAEFAQGFLHLERERPQISYKFSQIWSRKSQYTPPDLTRSSA